MNYDMKAKLSIINWERLNDYSKERLFEILKDLKIEVHDEMDRNELLWLLRLLAFQYLNHKRYYIYPLCYDTFALTQSPPFKPFDPQQNVISRQNKQETCELISNFTI